MSIISSCPHCRGEISLPAGSQPSRRMRCPLCSQIFKVSDAPPQAIPVTPAAYALVESETPADAEATSDAKTAAAKQLQVEYITETAGTEQPSSVLTSHRPSGGSGVVRHLIGTVLGGAIGLAIGYCILVRIGGARVDFLDIADQLPAFLVGELEDNTAETPPAPVIERPTTEPSRRTTPTANNHNQPLAELFPPPETGGQVTSSPWPPESGFHDPTGAAGNGQDAHQLPSDYLGPRDVTWYTAADLGEALAKAHGVLACEHCNSTGRIKQVDTQVKEIDGRDIESKAERLAECPVCRGEPVSKITPEIYADLARLAHVATFIKITDDDPTVWTRREAIVRILQQAGAKRDHAKAIGRLAGQWLRDVDRPTDGVALAGTVQAIDRDGPFYRTRIVLFGLPNVVTVLSDRQPPSRPQERVIVLGSIVDMPADQLVGYQGAEPQVVWGKLSVKLPSAEN